MAGTIFTGIIILILIDFYSDFILFSAIGLLISVLGLWIGSDFFVDQAVFFGERFSISGKMVGLVILSLAASIDELVLSLTAAFERYGEISIGNVQGSNIITFFVFLAISPFILKRRYEHFTKETLMLSLVYLALIYFTFTKLASFYVGAILVAVFIIYLAVARTGAPRSNINEITGHFSLPRATFGFALLFFASYELVKVVTAFSSFLDLSLFTSGFIFAGVSGSLPELFILASAIGKRQRDMSIGVVYGSTLFKVSLVLGLSMLVTYVDLGPALYTYFIMLILILAGSLLIIRYPVEKNRQSDT
jgi:cation:H+ antiporter